MKLFRILYHYYGVMYVDKVPHQAANNSLGTPTHEMYTIII